MPLFHYQNTNITINISFPATFYIDCFKKRETHKVQCRKFNKLLSMVFDKYYERTSYKKVQRT